MRFPNKAGRHGDTDDVLRAELESAGIVVEQNELYRRSCGEVHTSIVGTLHGWTFRRAWYYWVCEGPGIEAQAAERLHANHGQTVRVNGHCGCPSPREVFKGLACGLYHVDDAPGLKALADTIRALVVPDLVSVKLGDNAKPCHWREDGDGLWESECLHVAWHFSAGGPTENGMKFCYYCGRKLVVANAPGQLGADQRNAP